jgi:MinD-like ATPase involved in chromosome partitioning or flagellar assembly
VIQAVTAGLLRPGAADAMNEERVLVARVRSRPRHPRVIAVVSGKGGVGTSTTAAATAMVLAALRHDAIALLDPRHGTGSLGERLAGRAAPTIDQLTTPSTGPAPAPLRINGSLDVVDGAPWHRPVDATRLGAALAHLRDTHALTIVDVGNHPAENTRLVLSRADQVVVVAGATHNAVESARVALLRVRSVAPGLLSTAVVAVPSVASGSGRGHQTRLADELGVPDSSVVAVPFDPALVSGGAIVLRYVRPATRTAFLRLAGLIADPGTPTDDPLAVSPSPGALPRAAAA